MRKSYQMKPQAWSILVRLIGTLLSAGQTVVLARAMGPEDLGVYSSVLAVAVLFAGPASAGLSQYLTREVAVARSRDNSKLARGLIKSANHLVLILSGLAIAIFISLYLLSISPSGDIFTTVIASIIIVLSSADMVRSGAMRGTGSAILSQVPEQIIRPGMFLLLIWLLTVSTGSTGVQTALLAYAFASATSATFGQIILKGRVGGYRPATHVRIGNTIRRSSGQTIFGGVQTFIANIDILILSIISAFTAAGNHKVALLGVVGLLFIYNALSAVTVRDLASSLARGDLANTAQISDKLTFLGGGSVALVFSVYIFLGLPAINFIFGPDYAPAYVALVILSAGHLLASSFGPSIEISRLLHSQQAGVLISLFSLLLTIALSIGLIGIQLDPLVSVTIGSATGITARRALLALHVARTLDFRPDVISALIRTYKRAR